MALGRQFNWLGQMRVDVPHLRAVESSIVNDFTTLAGYALAGMNPYILSGFYISSWTAGTAPQTLQITVANGIVFNMNATDNAPMLQVPSTRTPEVLNTTNTRIIGGFAANSTNYVGVDFLRNADPTTNDIVQFIDATTLTQTPKIVPLGRTLDYQINISTTPFSSNTHLCPVAIVVTNSSGLITSVTDARTMYFRLAAGGSSPNPLGVYSWPQGRAPENTSLFTGGDKAITNEKDWKSAVMTRLWEVTGGEYWYSDCTDRNVKFGADPTAQHTRAGQTLNEIWDGTNITWSGLRVILNNSTSTVNLIPDQTTTSSGLTNMANGDVIYVELNRYIDNYTLATPVKVTNAQYNALPSPTRVGSRYVLFWRSNNQVYSRLDFVPVGYSSSTLAATTTALGDVKLSTADTASGPYAIIADGLGGNAVAAGLTRGNLAAGTLSIGGGTNDTTTVISGQDHATTIGNTAAHVTTEKGTLNAVAINCSAFPNTYDSDVFYDFMINNYIAVNAGTNPNIILWNLPNGIYEIEASGNVINNSTNTDVYYFQWNFTGGPYSGQGFGNMSLGNMRQVSAPGSVTGTGSNLTLYYDGLSLGFSPPFTVTSGYFAGFNLKFVLNYTVSTLTGIGINFYVGPAGGGAVDLYYSFKIRRMQ